MSVNCSGCFPIYQDNQQAHMEVGGCMYVDHVEFCQPVNYGSIFDRIAEEDRERAMGTTKAVAEPAKLYSNNDNECVICYESIGQTNNCVTPCGHAFCFKCLVSAMTLKNTCPCCRAELFDLPKEEEADDDEDSDYDGEDDDNDDGDDNQSDGDGDGDETLDNVPVETVVARLESKGYTMLDVVSIMLNNYSKLDPKYTNDHIANLNKSFDDLVADVENEYDEQRKFAQEDARTRANNRA